jgi:zinc protease
MINTATPPRRWTADVHREVLSNGLTLLVQRDDSAPAVAAVTRVRAAFFDEPDRWIGISHVQEHMFFKGTPSRAVGQIARETKAAGGYLNASTSYDRTSYFVVLPASALARAVDIQADALRHSSIDAGELERELRVIVQEAKRKLDTPDAVTYETLHEVMFDHHASVAGASEPRRSCRPIRRDDVAGYTSHATCPSDDRVGGRRRPGGWTLAVLRAAYGDWTASPGAVDPRRPSRGVRARAAHCAAT